MKKILMSGILHESGWILVGNFAYINLCFISLNKGFWIILENYNVIGM